MDLIFSLYILQTYQENNNGRSLVLFVTFEEPYEMKSHVRFWNRDGNSDVIIHYDYLTVQVQLI